MYTESASRTLSFSRRFELVLTQASVSSAWRLTQTVSEPTKTIRVPRTKSTQARIERVRGLTAGIITDFGG
jgi:hypothetical protein